MEAHHAGAHGAKVLGHLRFKRENPKSRSFTQIMATPGKMKSNPAPSEQSDQYDATMSTMSEKDKEKEKRRLQRKLKRYAKKQVELLADLGYDEMGEKRDSLDGLSVPMREWQFTLPGLRDPIALNPAVTMIAVVLLWAMVVWSSVKPAVALETIVAWRSHISLTCTSVFIGTRAVFFFFVLYVTYRYGHIHLGQKGDTPAFSNTSFLCMGIACGVAVGLFSYAVVEPLWHQESHHYAKAGYHSIDELSMHGLSLTLTNWGLSGWCIYVVVAVCASLAAHKFRLPMALRSCFYPILGQYTWGWMGDLVDGMAIIATVAGLSTSLGLGVLQIVGGLSYMGWVDPDSSQADMDRIHNVTIWFFTIISTASVLTGLHGGIQVLSSLAIMTGCLLLVLVLLLDDTKFLLNLQVQEVGYYFQHSIFELNLWTDAFGQLREGSGRATDGKASEEWWMDSWTVFYQAWWTAWAVFVGMFMACISRGRTIREVVLYSMCMPFGFCLVWFSTWGGIGLRQARQGKELEVLGETYYNNSGHFLVDGSEFCYDVPQGDVVVNGTVIFTNHLLGVSPVCQFDSGNSNAGAFNVLYSFHFSESMSMGPFLSVIFLLGCALFFVTSSDSATLVVDMLASNGRQNQHWARQCFWAITIGALASVLLLSGGAEALKAVQAASIVCALPVVVLMCYMLQSIQLFCAMAEKLGRDADYEFPNEPEFAMPIYGGVFNALEYLMSWGKVHTSRVELGMDLPTRSQLVEFGMGLVLPFVSLHKVMASTYPHNPKTNSAIVAFYTLCYTGWVGIFIASATYPGIVALRWTLFIAAGSILGWVRSSFRAKYNIRSNGVADFISGLCFWPQALTQMRLQCAPKGDRDDSVDHVA